MFFEVASVVIDAIRMFEFTKETYFFEYVLPFLQGLFATIWHLFDGHDLKFWKQKKFVKLQHVNNWVKQTKSREIVMILWENTSSYYPKAPDFIGYEKLQLQGRRKVWKYRGGIICPHGWNRSKLSAKIWLVPQFLRPWILSLSWKRLKVSKAVHNYIKCQNLIKLW